jgi:hypothetical protein
MAIKIGINDNLAKRHNMEQPVLIISATNKKIYILIDKKTVDVCKSAG